MADSGEDEMRLTLLRSTDITAHGGGGGIFLVSAEIDVLEAVGTSQVARSVR
jgi:hypothetical protein